MNSIEEIQERINFLHFLLAGAEEKNLFQSLLVAMADSEPEMIIDRAIHLTYLSFQKIQEFLAERSELLKLVEIWRQLQIENRQERFELALAWKDFPTSDPQLPNDWIKAGCKNPNEATEILNAGIPLVNASLKINTQKTIAKRISDKEITISEGKEIIQKYQKSARF